MFRFMATVINHSDQGYPNVQHVGAARDNLYRPGGCITEMQRVLAIIGQRFTHLHTFRSARVRSSRLGFNCF